MPINPTPLSLFLLPVHWIKHRILERWRGREVAWDSGDERRRDLGWTLLR